MTKEEKENETPEEKKAREYRESPEGKEAARIAKLPPLNQADIMRAAQDETVALREAKQKDQKAEEKANKS